MVSVYYIEDSIGRPRGLLQCTKSGREVVRKGRSSNLKQIFALTVRLDEEICIFPYAFGVMDDPPHIGTSSFALQDSNVIPPQAMSPWHMMDLQQRGAPQFGMDVHYAESLGKCFLSFSDCSARARICSRLLKQNLGMRQQGRLKFGPICPENSE